MTILMPMTAFKSREWGSEYDEFGYMNLPSLSSVILTSSPRLALSYSVNSFMAGLGVYLGSIWKRGLDEESGDRDSQKVFIIYIVVIVICYFFYAQVYLVHARQESYAKQDKVLARLQKLRKDTMEKAGCSTVSEYREWRRRRLVGRDGEERGTDVENTHGYVSQSS
jgi:hypothetical protein